MSLINYRGFRDIQEGKFYQQWGIKEKRREKIGVEVGCLHREKMIEEILSFVSAHKESQASRAVAMRILGVRNIVEVNDQALEELHDRIAQAETEELELCYDIIS